MVQPDQELTRSRICEEYLDLFSGIGCLPGEYDIELDSNILPVQNRPRKVPHMMKSAVEEKMRSLVHVGTSRVSDGMDQQSNGCLEGGQETSTCMSRPS